MTVGGPVSNSLKSDNGITSDALSNQPKINKASVKPQNDATFPELMNDLHKGLEKK